MPRAFWELLRLVSLLFIATGYTSYTSWVKRVISESLSPSWLSLVTPLWLVLAGVVIGLPMSKRPSRSETIAAASLTGAFLLANGLWAMHVSLPGMFFRPAVQMAGGVIAPIWLGVAITKWFAVSNPVQDASSEAIRPSSR